MLLASPLFVLRVGINFCAHTKRQVNLGSQVSRPAAMEVEVVNQIILCVFDESMAKRSLVSVSIICQQSRHSRQHKIASLRRMIINSEENQPAL